MKQKNYLGIGIALGAGIGTAFGVVMDNIGMGIAIGAGVGIAMGAAMSKKKDKDNSEDI